MENVKDWCISRQLWWGHRIPVWYCDDCGETIVSKTDPTECPKCKSKRIRQDEDVLDTWFSSALWPFSTLGFPEKTEDLQYFYPTNVLVTGYDIIFFWVARMIFSGLEHMKERPFDTVLIHGIVRDDQGRKMSKSLGNGIDPLKIIDDYGADTLRFSLVAGIAQGSDIRFSTEKCESSRNFINKLWNASRFVLMNAEGVEIKPLAGLRLSVADKWILSRLNAAIKSVTKSMDKYDLGVALGTLHDFVWYDFCDWYIELAKSDLYGEDEAAKSKTVSVLVSVLADSLKMLHPFIPFVTEEIYRNIPTGEKSIMVSDYPIYNPRRSYKKENEQMTSIMEIIKAVRLIKAQTGAAQSKRVDVILVTDKQKLVQDCAGYLRKLAGVEKISFVASKAEIGEKVVSVVLDGFELYVPLGELVDIEKEIERLKAELVKADEEMKRAEAKLQNVGFVEKAPKNLVESEREKVAKYAEMKAKIMANLKEYES